MWIHHPNDRTQGNAIHRRSDFSRPVSSQYFKLFRDWNPRQILVCHCDDCRRLATARDSYFFTRDARLTWYSSLTWAQWQFCNQCGSKMYYRLDSGEMMLVSAGMFNNTNEMTVED